MKSILVIECTLIVLSVAIALPLDQGNPNQVLVQSPPSPQQTNDGPFVRVIELSEWDPVPDGVPQIPPVPTNFYRPVQVQQTPNAVVVPPVQPHERYYNYVLINGKPYYYDPYVYYGIG